jgi:signal transduction histidine kinase
MNAPTASTALPTDALLSGQREVLALIAEGGPLRRVLGEIARYAEACTPQMLASILWYEPSSGALRRGGHARLPDAFADTVDGLVPGPAAGSCGTAAFRRERVVSFDVQVDPLWSAFRPFAAHHGIRSAWSTPLLSPSDGSLLGVFGMYYPDTRAPSEADIRLVDHFTHLAAIAIERQRRDEALRESERATRLGLLALVAGMAHELNTPLGVARLANALVREEIAPGSDAPQARVFASVDLVGDNIERALQLVGAFKASLLDVGADPPTTLDVVEQVGTTIAQLAPALSARRLEVKITAPNEPPLVIRAPQTRIAEIVSNLALNTATHAYGDAGGRLDIVVEPSALRPDRVALIFTDSGRGMPEDERARCVDAFYTTARRAGNTGLGLFLVKHIAEAELGGSLLIESHPGTGTRVTVLLPLRTSPEST